jgi:outer membrane protein OmpA-like peptidoglycan-associated protein
VHIKYLRYLLISVTLFSFAFLTGCAGLEFAPKRAVWYYPKELVKADKAVAAAKKAGKKRECPVEYREAKAVKEKAYDVYLSCKTKESLVIAREAIDKANALCPKHPRVLAKFTLTINFDFDKYRIRKADQEQLDKAIAFIKKYPHNKIRLEGFTDSIGSMKYNQRLSERRARATKKYLMKHAGVDAMRIATEGYGETRPVASNKTRAGRAENRRVEILILE